MILVDTAAAAAAVGVAPGVIRIWSHRGHLQRHGKDAKGRTVYDLQEVHDTARLLRARTVQRARTNV